MQEIWPSMRRFAYDSETIQSQKFSERNDGKESFMSIGILCEQAIANHSICRWFPSNCPPSLHWCVKEFSAGPSTISNARTEKIEPVRSIIHAIDGGRWKKNDDIRIMFEERSFEDESSTVPSLGWAIVDVDIQRISSRYYRSRTSNVSLQTSTKIAFISHTDQHQSSFSESKSNPQCSSTRSMLLGAAEQNVFVRMRQCHGRHPYHDEQRQLRRRRYHTLSIAISKESQAGESSTPMVFIGYVEDYSS